MIEVRINTKTLTIITLFAAVSIVLSLSPLKFSAPFATFLKYNVWEIAIVTAFLLYGMKVGISIALINTLVLFVFFPGDLPSGPIYNFIAVASTISGIYIIQKILSKFSKNEQSILVILSTMFGIFCRVVVMSIVNWFALPLPLPFGYSLPQSALPVYLPVIALFNATILLYTIPIAFIITSTVRVYTKI